ncbi:MAG: outer membrane lipoprotein-sorting protein [Elusimicrobia bacterium]|nr:outer membrane lipoprotein-sorting protein [Elusimicrobiota bacterium]
MSKLFVLWLWVISGSAALTPSPEEIIAKADEVRMPQSDYEVRVTVTSYDSGQVQKSAKYRVMVRGREKAIVQATDPETDRGRTLLMIGRDMWLFLPHVSQPVRVSLRERLLGEVANGDVARTNFADDYQARLLSQKSDAEHYALELLAKSDTATYRRIIYWVRKDNFHPHKAEYYAVSGRLLKRGMYQGYAPLGGRLRPLRLILEDNFVRSRRSIIEYDNDIKIREIPEKYFTKHFLKRLK